MSFNLKDLFSRGAEKLAASVGKAFDDNFTNREEMARAGIDLEKVKADIIKETNRHLEAIQASADKELELQNANTANARQRETEFVKATGHADWMQVGVGAIIMLSFFAALIIVGFKAIPQGNEHIMINAIGILEGLVMSVAGYYFGSSLGSKIKDIKK